MSAEMDKKRFGFAATARTLGYALGIIVRHQPLYLVFLLGAGVCKGLMPFIAVLLPKLVLEELSGAKDPVRLALLVLAAAGLSGLLYWLAGLLELRRDRENDKFDKLVDKLLAQKTLTMDYPHLENPEVLTLIQQYRQGRMTNGGLTGAFGWALANGLPALITMAGMAYLVLQLNVWVQLSILATTAATLWTLYVSMDADNQMMLSCGDTNRIMDYYIGVTYDFANAKDIRLYQGDKLISSRIRWTVEDIFRAAAKGYGTIARSTIVRAMLLQLQMVAIYAVLTVQAIRNGMSIADYVMYTAAAVSFTNALISAAVAAVNFYGTIRLVNPLREYMHLPAVLKKGDQPVPAEQTEDVLVFEDVSFTYPRAEMPVLRHLNLTLRRGEKLAVVGENGAGKTTMIKLMLRLYDPDEGRILLGGRDVTQMSLDEYLERFAVVFQDFKLLAFSVRENLCVGEEAERERLDAVLAKLGLDETLSKTERGADTSVYKLFDEKGVEFSGGERQKMAIARALYKDSPIVVMDEPTAALDPIAEEEIYRHMGGLVQGKTAVFISHRLSSCRFCDRVAVFEGGRVTQCGPHEQLMQQDGLYRRMFEAQAQYYV